MERFNLGYTEEMEAYRLNNGYNDFRVGRIILEHKERYVVLDENGEYDAEILGQLRFNAEKRRDFPAIGDWVVFQEFNKNQAIIHSILPRTNLLERKSVSSESSTQLIATNIDTAFIVVATDRDFSINRIQRYLALVLASQIEPIIVLNKIDLISEEESKLLVQEIQNRIPEVRILMASCKNNTGLQELHSMLEPNKTYCLLGSSGVGKSTLINQLLEENLIPTASISEATVRGRHTTTHRELILLKNGAMIIDNPGMREVGMTSTSAGIEETFDYIIELASNCQYSDCKHSLESGCEVLKALKNGNLSQADYYNYIRLQKEQEHFESSEIERKQKGKELSKHIKNYYKSKGR